MIVRSGGENMTLLQLQYFCALARNCHYTHTAQELHISQPTLSYSIHELERELGGPLFERRKGRVELTSYGEAFLPFVLAAQQQLEKGIATLHDMIGVTDSAIRLGYFRSIADTLLPVLVRDFSREDGHRIHYEMTEGVSEVTLSLLKEGKLDLVFTTKQVDWCESVMVQNQPLYLAVSRENPLSSRSAVTFRDFCDEPMIAFLRPSPLREQIDNIFNKHLVLQKIAFEVRDSSVALQYVALNFGMAVLPDTEIYNHEHVVLLPIHDDQAEFTRPVFCAWHSDRPLRGDAAAFRDYIKRRSAEKENIEHAT